MKYHWICWMCVLLTVGSVSVAIGAIPPVYTVDYKLLFLFHPKMAEFDLTLGRHLKPGVKTFDPGSREALSREMERLNVEAKKTVEAQQQLIAQWTQEQLEGGMHSNPSASASPVLLLETEKKRKAELQARIDSAKRIQEEALDRVFDPMYLSRDESRSIMEGVLTEIDTELERMSQVRGGALILDADFVEATPVPRRFHPSAIPCLDLVDIGLRQSLLDHDFTPGQMPVLYTQRPELQLKFAEAMQRLKGFEDGVATTLSRYPGVAAVLGARGRLILAGGKDQDLTREVFAELYRKHQIRPEVAAKILELVLPTEAGQKSVPVGSPGVSPESGSSRPSKSGTMNPGVRK